MEKPEFVCTCCHKWLICKTVISYDYSKYDMTNDVVKEALDLSIIIQCMWLYSRVFVLHMNIQLTIVLLILNLMMVQMMKILFMMNFSHTKHEYICVTCHNSMKCKNPKMHRHVQMD